jgi:DNA repair protein RecO (recombination protein O)
MPLHTADALVLRTYKLGEADRIVVFLTAARRPRSRFRGALEPLTHVQLAYFESERRELVGLNYADAVTSPLSAASPEALGYSHYFAELIDEWAAEGDPDERLFRLGIAALEALVRGVAVEPLARYFECWLLRLQGVYPADLPLSAPAAAFVEAARRVGPREVGHLAASPAALGELEGVHRRLIAAHLEREPRSIRVIHELKRAPAGFPP